MHPARGSGVEADGSALAASPPGGGVECLLKDRSKGARRQEVDQCRSTARDRNADSQGEAQTHNERADVGCGDRCRSHDRAARWKEHALKPHLSRPFKLSNDPKFAEKVVDMVGHYLDPPDRAVAIARNRACR
jgi:hypothetical protein